MCIICTDSSLSQGNPDLVPSILTLALNDAVTYDKVGQNSLLIFLQEIYEKENLM